jgi:hypothetical protein
MLVGLAISEDPIQMKAEGMLFNYKDIEGI